jgi:hypothetical protein
MPQLPRQRISKNALMEFAGRNAVKPSPLPRSANSIQGLSPNTGMGDEDKLNSTKGSEKERVLSRNSKKKKKY